MPSTFFPLRWESTGDRWWFASPIDWAAANGHYDLVKELLHMDANLLIKLTSLPRTRRLETVWDDEESFNDVAKCRSKVAQKLLLDSDTKKRYISLIRAGYGGWLLYTAAAAGDMDFVKELLDREPLLVFGEGEYGVTDMFYAAARSKSRDVFKLLFDYSVSPMGQLTEESSVFRSEMFNRAVHAAARGGGLEILMELLEDQTDDPLDYRDAKGSTLLHSAAGRGQVQIVKHLISSHNNILDSVDNQGNTSLHVAAYFGQLPVIKLLLSASPSSASVTNNNGDTFLHMAVSGFGSTDFRRLDRQIELIEQLITGSNFQDMINVQNKDGRTPLHLAVINNIRGDIIDLIMSVPSISLEIRDVDGKTPLDLLRQRPHTVSYEILMKLISAGGISSDTWDEETRNAIVSDMRSHGIGTSPGTSFRIPDAEIFLYTGFDDLSRFSSDYISYCSELQRISSRVESTTSSKQKKMIGSDHRTTSQLKNFLLKPRRKAVNHNDVDETGSVKSNESNKEGNEIPLKRLSSLPSNKRVQSSQQRNLMSPLSRKNLSEVGGVVGNLGSPSSTFSDSWWPSEDKGRGRGAVGVEKIRGTQAPSRKMNELSNGSLERYQHQENVG